MFRISKQLALSQSIRDCQTVEELCQWFRVIIDQIDIHDARKITSKTFLQFKSRFSNQLIDYLLVSGPMQYKNNEIDNDSDSVETNNNHNNQHMHCKENKTICKLDSLPHAVLSHISFYLSMVSNLNLSMTSHSFHEKIQNNNCLGVNKSYDTVELNPIMIDAILRNNCIMECIHKYSAIDIQTINNHPYSYYRCTDCPLSRLIDKIENSNKNYDLSWFETIWGSMTYIFISNRYPCALQHLPISWIFEDKYNDLKPIYLLAASEGNDERESRINKSTIERFAKSVKNYINDNPDKKFRQLQRICYKRDECDLIEIHSSFGNNLTGIFLDLPRLWDNECRFKDLDTFFKIFHENVNWLEIHIDYDNIGNHTIISQLFKNNRQLCDDLNKTEEQLPFNQFLKKYNCQNKCLPKFDHLAIDFDKLFSYEQSVLFKLFNNDKIMKLLNVQQSVCSVSFLLLPCLTEVIEHKMDIENLIGVTLSKLDNLTACRYTVRTQNTINQQEMKQCYDLSNTILLQMLLKPKAKHVYAIISPKKWTDERMIKFSLKIENKNELLYCNRDALKRKISSLVNDSIQATNQIWCKNKVVKIEQCFQLERDF